VRLQGVIFDRCIGAKFKLLSRGPVGFSRCARHHNIRSWFKISGRTSQLRKLFEEVPLQSPTANVVDTGEELSAELIKAREMIDSVCVAEREWPTKAKAGSDALLKCAAAICVLIQQSPLS